ncbi:hypothetical protein BpHYR1_019786, partial [Brachionus plicatilis]
MAFDGHFLATTLLSCFDEFGGFAKPGYALANVLLVALVLGLVVLGQSVVEHFLGLGEHYLDQGGQGFWIKVRGAVVARRCQRVFANVAETASCLLIQLGCCLQTFIGVQCLNAGQFRAERANVEQHTQAF